MSYMGIKMSNSIFISHFANSTSDIGNRTLTTNLQFSIKKVQDEKNEENV